MCNLPPTPTIAAALVLAAAWPCFSVGAEVPATLTRLGSGGWTAPLSWAAGDDPSPTDWQPGAEAVIAAGLSVNVDAPVNTSGLSLEGSVRLSSHPLTVSGPLEGAGTFRMPNIAGSFGESGLVFATGSAVESRHTITLADTTNGKVVVAALGEGTEVTYNGFWDGWGTNTRHDIRIGGGARFVFGPDAQVNNQMRDLVRARAAYAIGDGHPDNILEFDEGFNADMGTAEAPKGGLSTLRVGSLTMITHATQNLPTIHKFKGDGSPTHHGLLIFDQDDGAHWIVRTQDQEYDGGIYWRYDWQLKTETDLTSIPVNAPGEDVGFGSTAQGTVLTKRGAGTLRLDHAQGYAADSTMRIEEGAVEFLSNPYQTWFSGFMRAAGNHLFLDISGSSRAAFFPQAGETFSVAGITLEGAGLLHVGGGRLYVEHELDTVSEASIRVVLGESDLEGVKIDARAGLVDGSTLVIEAGDGFGSGEYPLFPAGTELEVRPGAVVAPAGYAAQFTPATGILTVVAEETIDYEAWQSLWFAPQDAATGPGDDFSGDGLPNVFAFAFDYDPRKTTTLASVPAAPRIVERAEGRVFRFQADPARAGAAIAVKASRDLAEWVPIETTGIFGGDPHERGVRIDEAAPLRFFRVKVTYGE